MKKIAITGLMGLMIGGLLFVGCGKVQESLAQPSPPIVPDLLLVPITDFTWEGKYAGEEIKFIDKSSNAISWLWDFGDGNKSEEQNPQYLYQTPGVYSVTLEVKNLVGDLAKKTKKVLIFEKGGVWLMEFKFIGSPPEAGRISGAIITFLADDGAEIHQAYLSITRDGRPMFRGESRPWGIKEIDYLSPGKFFIAIKFHRGGYYYNECYVRYRASDGTIRESNRVVSGEIYVK